MSHLTVHYVTGSVKTLNIFFIVIDQLNAQIIVL